MTATPAVSGRAQNASTYWPQLDGLRAVAVGAVLVGHTWTRHFLGAEVGVGVFFALSGYLITGLLADELGRTGRIDFPRFMGRRALRLLPALFLMLAVMLPLLRPPVGDAFAAVFYYANWWRAAGHSMGAFGHLWSLSIEEQFYIAWPLVLAGSYAAGRLRGVLTSALGLSVLSIGLRLMLEGDYWRVSNGLDTRMDGLLAGAVVALALRLAPDATRSVLRWVGPVAVVLIGALCLGHEAWPGLAVYYTAMAWASAGLVGYLVSGYGAPLERALSWGPLVHLGKVSYGLYLWHYPVYFFLGGLLTMPYAARLPATAVCTYIVAVVSFYWLERPLSRLLGPALRPRS